MATVEKIVPAPGITAWTDKHGVTREYREVQRKAAVGELVKVVSGIGAFFQIGDVLIVEKTDYVTPAVGGSRGNVLDGRYVVLEPTDIVHYDGKRWREVKKPGSPYSYEIVRNGLRIYLEPIDEQPDRLTALEQRVSHLSAEVAHLRRVVAVRVTANSVADRNEGALQKMTYVFGDMFKPNATPQLTRADVIELAKKDVEELLRTRNEDVRGIGWYDPKLDAVKFQVNRQKRTVVALISAKPSSGYGTHVWTRGIAKSAPDDCFNVHIGKAIALRRALGLDVPDYYVNAPKPTEAQVGDVVRFMSAKRHSYTILRDRKDFRNNDTGNVTTNCDYKYLTHEDNILIIDDSHDFGGDSATGSENVG